MKLNKKLELGISAVQALKQRGKPTRTVDLATEIGTTLHFLECDCLFSQEGSHYGSSYTKRDCNCRCRWSNSVRWHFRDMPPYILRQR